MSSETKTVVSSDAESKTAMESIIPSSRQLFIRPKFQYVTPKSLLTPTGQGKVLSKSTLIAYIG